MLSEVRIKCELFYYGNIELEMTYQYRGEKCEGVIYLFGKGWMQKKRWEKYKFRKCFNFFFTFDTECARDPDLYELVSCRKFVDEILFCAIYKTLYFTWGHHALGVILCLCFNYFELSTAELFFQSQSSLKIRGSIFLSMKVRIPGTPGIFHIWHMLRLALSKGNVLTLWQFLVYITNWT